jgi:hypothetical protein
MTESVRPASTGTTKPSSIPPPLTRRTPVPRVRSGFVVPALTSLAMAAGLLLGLASLGLLPAREPALQKPVAFDPDKTVDAPRLPEQDDSTRGKALGVHKLLVWSFPLCARPREGARMYRVALRPERDSFVVWCQGEYVLVDVEAQAETPRVTRLARFAVRGELPGGATALDLDHDGVLDLVLGVAPALGLVHRPFSGVFWLRGRAQGGFDLPRTLVEMPVLSVASAELDEAPGSELLVLTRGDTAAQRAGELWVFAGGTSPTRAAVVPTALAPSDLAVGTARDGLFEVWVSATQPGSLVRLRFPRLPAEWGKPERTELPLRGVQAFVTPPREEHALYVRDVTSVRALEAGEPPRLDTWIEHAEVGPAAWLRSGPGDKRALVGATQGGFAWFQGDTRRDRNLPLGTRLVDASSTTAAASHERAVLLLETAEQDGNLALALLPIEVRNEALELELRSGAVEAAPTEARVVLE